jgi:hypothetical protein
MFALNGAKCFVRAALFIYSVQNKGIHHFIRSLEMSQRPEMKIAQQTVETMLSLGGNNR